MGGGHGLTPGGPVLGSLAKSIDIEGARRLDSQTETHPTASPSRFTACLVRGSMASNQTGGLRASRPHSVRETTLPYITARKIQGKSGTRKRAATAPPSTSGLTLFSRVMSQSHTRRPHPCSHHPTFLFEFSTTGHPAGRTEEKRGGWQVEPHSIYGRRTSCRVRGRGMQFVARAASGRRPLVLRCHNFLARGNGAGADQAADRSRAAR